ncbi:hypothetical protein L596_028166 [Steinernema carpocapsae]|uniref:Uncharacterized protein n=1 Tax=Steinernema carpocapsae TaxID=34508 RepID=A0A4U5LXR2_STECR|nr:hypothetical protein L596_028166 [Steinernema carpocapsae]
MIDDDLSAFRLLQLSQSPVFVFSLSVLLLSSLGSSPRAAPGGEKNDSPSWTSHLRPDRLRKAPSSGVSSPSLAPQRTDSRATSSNGSTQQSSQPENQKVQLTAFISHLCGQLRKVVSFVNEIAVETDRDRRHPADLLTDLESKVLPFLMQIDEDMTEMERLIRCNIDSCNINDPDVDWLLSYNKYQIEMRRVWQSLSTNVFADLESVLDTRRRGVLGVSPKEETLENLGAMRIGMDRAMSLIMKESEC